MKKIIIMDEDLAEALRDAAYKLGLSQSYIARKALKLYLTAEGFYAPLKGKRGARK